MGESVSSQNSINKHILILIILFFFINVTCMGIIYFWQNSLVKSSNEKVNVINAKMIKQVKEIEYLTNISKTPSFSELGHSNCLKNDSSSYALSSFNVQPINGYQVFDQICLDEGPKVPSFQGLVSTDTHRAIGFKVNSDGTRYFAFGVVMDGNTLCIPKMIPEADRNKISSELKLPACINGS